MITICSIKSFLKIIWLIISLSIGSISLIYSDTNFTASHSTTIQNPVQHQNLVGIVEVSFKITEQGKADIISLKSDNPDLIHYVKTKLNKIRLEKDDFNIDEVITYKLVFGEQNA